MTKLILFLKTTLRINTSHSNVANSHITYMFSYLKSEK